MFCGEKTDPYVALHKSETIFKVINGSKCRIRGQVTISVQFITWFIINLSYCTLYDLLLEKRFDLTFFVTQSFFEKYQSCSQGKLFWKSRKSPKIIIVEILLWWICSLSKLKSFNNICFPTLLLQLLYRLLDTKNFIICSKVTSFLCMAFIKAAFSNIL